MKAPIARASREIEPTSSLIVQNDRSHYHQLKQHNYAPPIYIFLFLVERAVKVISRAWGVCCSFRNGRDSGRLIKRSLEKLVSAMPSQTSAHTLGRLSSRPLETTVLRAENRVFSIYEDSRTWRVQTDWIKRAPYRRQVVTFVAIYASVLILLALINLFSPQRRRQRLVITYAVIQWNKAKCSLFTHNLFFLSTMRWLTLSHSPPLPPRSHIAETAKGC